MKLPKWPRLYVTGEPVTPEQADLIIIRTTELMMLHTDDETWDRMVARTFGIELDDSRYPTHEERERVMKSLGMLDLGYLNANTNRISTVSTNGPSGWCDWDGTIGWADGGLTGKWPHIDEVWAEWNQVARAFPFLRLTAQLTSDGWENGGDGTARVPLVQWEVSDGVVSMVTPGPLLHPVPVEEDVTDAWERRVDGFLEKRDAVRRRGWGFEPVNNEERGVTWERLKTAVERARTEQAEKERSKG